MLSPRLLATFRRKIHELNLAFSINPSEAACWIEQNSFAPDRNRAVLGDRPWVGHHHCSPKTYFLKNVLKHLDFPAHVMYHHVG